MTRRIFVSLWLLALLSPLPYAGGCTPTAIDDGQSVQERQTATGGTMQIEGTVVEVMESWPLQLTVDVQGSHTTVQLQEGTPVHYKEGAAQAADLRIGTRVSIILATSTGTRTAKEITILALP